MTIEGGEIKIKWSVVLKERAGIKYPDCFLILFSHSFCEMPKPYHFKSLNSNHAIVGSKKA